MNILLKVALRLKSKMREKTAIDLAYESYMKDHGEELLRLNYNILNENSIVFDLGGYKGNWTSDIFSKYCSEVYVFEPAHRFYAGIVERFHCNPKIKVFNFGLANENIDIKMALSNDASSIYKNVDDGMYDLVKLVNATEFFKEKNIKHIDLMKINIEGGEYDLLEHLLDSGFVKNIENIQVQFHAFVPNAEERLHKIEERLSVSHKRTYHYKFIWENWQRIK